MIRGNVQIMPGTIGDSLIDPDSQLKSSSYFASVGTTDTFNYNADGTVSSVVTSFPGGVTRTISYTRDLSGLVTSYSISFSDNSYSATYNISRDSSGRVTSVTKV